MQTREFIVSARQQREWGWLVIFAVFCTGIGAGLGFIALVLGAVLGMVVGVVLVLGGCLFLLGDLSRRQPVWRLLSRPQSSWMTRGSIGILSFAILTSVHIVYLVIQPNGWASLGAPWAAGPVWVMVLGIVAAIAALFVVIYPGFLLGRMRPISFWNSAFLPALFLVSGLLGGLGIVYLLPLSWKGVPWALPFLENIGGGLVVFELVLLLGLIWIAHPKSTGESVSLFIRGSLRFHFFVGVLGLGLIVPLVILGFVSIGMGVASLLIIEGVLHLLGVFLLRYIIFRASMFASPI
ncbi:NrfD/PsrC family molybdoenzyme membrane anchor subunit [Chloroflexota bacterium]